MFSVGLTGTVASGKSTVAYLFSELGITLISADEISKELTQPRQTSFKQIVEHFGPDALTNSGELNRRYIRQIIFSNPLEKLWLENLLHPLIRKTIEERSQNCEGPYCIVEIPLLIDRLHYNYLNRILLVTADVETRIKRLIERDNHTREEALLILAAQHDEEQYKKIADDVIENHGNIEDLAQAVAQLHLQYSQMR